MELITSGLIAIISNEKVQDLALEGVKFIATEIWNYMQGDENAEMENACKDLKTQVKLTDQNAQVRCKIELALKIRQIQHEFDARIDKIEEIGLKHATIQQLQAIKAMLDQLNSGEQISIEHIMPPPLKKELKRIASGQISLETSEDIATQTREYCIKSNQNSLDDLDSTAQSTESNQDILNESVLELTGKSQFYFDLSGIIKINPPKLYVKSIEYEEVDYLMSIYKLNSYFDIHKLMLPQNLSEQVQEAKSAKTAQDLLKNIVKFDIGEDIDQNALEVPHIRVASGLPIEMNSMKKLKDFAPALQVGEKADEQLGESWGFVAWSDDGKRANHAGRDWVRAQSNSEQLMRPSKDRIMSNWGGDVQGVEGGTKMPSNKIREKIERSSIHMLIQRQHQAMPNSGNKTTGISLLGKGTEVNDDRKVCGIKSLKSFDSSSLIQYEIKGVPVDSRQANSKHSEEVQQERMKILLEL